MDRWRSEHQARTDSTHCTEPINKGMETASLGTDSQPVPLITVASTDLQRQAGKLLHEVDRGAVVRIPDLQHGEVRGYLTRECPEAVRQVVEQEGPARLCCSPGASPPGPGQHWPSLRT
jgi:hypothetical protein